MEDFDMAYISNTNGEAKSSPGMANGFANGVASQAKEVAEHAATKAKDLVSTRVAEETGKKAGDIGDVAKALHETSKQLEGNIASPYVDKAADQLDKLSSFLRTASVPEIARNVETFARKEPLLFLGGAFVLGMAGARFLKSSARNVEMGEGKESEQRYTGPSGYYPDPETYGQGSK
jgi:hypothetical protein